MGWLWVMHALPIRHSSTTSQGTQGKDKLPSATRVGLKHPKACANANHVRLSFHHQTCPDSTHQISCVTGHRGHTGHGSSRQPTHNKQRSQGQNLAPQPSQGASQLAVTTLRLSVNMATPWNGRVPLLLYRSQHTDVPVYASYESPSQPIPSGMPVTCPQLNMVSMTSVRTQPRLTARCALPAKCLSKLFTYHTHTHIAMPVVWPAHSQRARRVVQGSSRDINRTEER